MQVHHRLIIRHPKDGTILVEDRDGTCMLPRVVADDRHTAEVDYLNAAVADRWGLTTTVLRSLSHSLDREPVVRIHELQAYGLRPPQPDGMRWVGPDPRSFDPADRAAIVAWRTGSRSDADWADPRWFDRARGWIDQAMLDAGLGPADSIVQLRVWSSCVLRVQAADAAYYFKALPQAGPECAVTQYLARHFPDVMPHIVKCDPRRGWLLLAECAGQKLEDVVDPAWWERAALRYGRLQADCVAHVAALRALGCPMHDLGTLARTIEPLCNDAGALREAEPNGLSSDEIARLRRAVPTLRRHCEQLGAAGIALTLEHGDLWPGNIFVDADHCAVIDWEDVLIAHPFFSLAPLSVGLRGSSAYTPALLTQLESAYLSAFTGIAPKARLRSALHLAAPLGFIDMAIRYRHERPSVVALHPWMRDLVPETLRLALAGLDQDAG